MEKKGVNRVFLSIILIHLLVVVILTVVPDAVSIGIAQNLIISELILLVPGVVYILFYKKEKSISDRMSFHKVKPSTFFMTILFTFMIMPLTTLLNAISMLFVDNAVLQISPQVLQMPFLLIFFLMAVYGPFCEEFVFRGIIFGGYRKSGRLLCATLLSGFLFGLMHMNLNQFGYAFAIGIALALLMEASGSIWMTMLCHFLFNAQSVCLMFLVNHFMPGLYEQQIQNQATANDQMYITISVYLVIATFTTVIAACILNWISTNEGRGNLYEKLRLKTAKTDTQQVYIQNPDIQQTDIQYSDIQNPDIQQPGTQNPGAQKSDAKKTLWTPSLVAAVILAVLFIAVELILTNTFGS